jgi:two-component system response regulator DevR
VVHGLAVEYNGGMQNPHSRYLRVFLVDDHDIVRRGVRDLLIAARDIDVVGDAGSARDAVSAILRLEPDVMLLDLHLQGATGIEVCRAVRSVNPSIAGLILTAAGDDEASAAAVLAGASGYLVKVSRSTHLIGAIREVRPNTSLLDAGSVDRASKLLERALDLLTPPATAEERQILRLVIDGQTDSQIAETLAKSGYPLNSDIVTLVGRVTQAVLGNGSPAVERGHGRHRRPD